MSRLTILLMLLGLLASPLLQAADYKIAVVNIQRVLEESPQYNKAKSALDAEFGPREQDMLSKQKEIRRMEERLVRDAAVMSESQRSKLEREVMSKKRDFGRAQESFRDDLTFKRNELLEKLQVEVLTKVQKYASQAKVDILFAEGVLYANPKLDITEDVLKVLRK